MPADRDNAMLEAKLYPPPDNLKSGVTRPCYYDPELNPTYRDLATHYGAAVLLAQRWILAKLRKQRFFSPAITTVPTDQGLIRWP